MSFAISPGTSVERMLQALGQEPATPEPATPEPVAPAKRARVGGKFKADDPATPENEAWEPET
jgi:hypothetical protein